MDLLGNLSQCRCLIILCTLCSSFLSESRPVRRSVSEMQLMHDLGRLLYDSKRQELIKDMVRNVHTASEKDLTPHPEPLGLKQPRSCNLAPAARRQQNRGKKRKARNSLKERTKNVSADDLLETGTLQDPNSLPMASRYSMSFPLD
ncbi:parathyroid hormone-like [Hypanus sabinus]|uniref:parathyroid hormone-like n=1 Tax=Hypanus sabinus TaxID=79690 RepID=UPI0028C3EAA4|nr:parathyroid hormone-like [Hypanus sabinus]